MLGKTKNLTRVERMACKICEAHCAIEGTSRSTEALLPQPTMRECLVGQEQAETGNLGTIAQRLDLIQTPSSTNYNHDRELTVAIEKCLRSTFNALNSVPASDAKTSKDA